MYFTSNYKSQLEKDVDQVSLCYFFFLLNSET